MPGEWGGGSSCFLVNLTAPMIAQGTITGFLLAALVWVGAGFLGLIILGILLTILAGLCAIVCDLGPWPDCGAPWCEGSEGGGGGCCLDSCCDECCGGSEPGGGGGSGGSGGGGGGGGTGGGGTGGGSGGGSALAWHARLAHHPATPAYAQDVYPIGAARLCIGCFTTYPMFLVVVGYLFLSQPGVSWAAAVSVGLAAAGLQGISSAGLARARIAKVTVKAGLGLGLALFVYGVLTSPMPAGLQFLALAAVLVLAVLSAVPRARRMRAHCASAPHRRAGSGPTLVQLPCDDPTGSGRTQRTNR